MRHLPYLIFMLLISCDGKRERESSNFFSNKRFSLDTVIIDPGDEIIFLRNHLLSADISKDGKYLFNFNRNDHTVERINLEELRLEDKYPFETEGPNGTGSDVGMMKVYNESQITLNGMNHTALFSLDGKKLMTIFFENFFGGHPMQGGEILKPDRVLDTDTKRLYGLIYRYNDESYALGILHLEELEISKIALKSFEKVSDFDIIYTPGGSRIVYAPGVHLDKFDTKVILSNEVTSTLMWYDSKIDSLYIKSYNSQLTANQKEKDYKKEHESLEEFEAENRRLKQEINFLPPFWDQKSQRFYRFSYQELPASNAGEGRIKSKVYLTILDRDLNQIGETQVPQLTKIPGKHFAKDGKIWIYENMNDEMGFVRLTMSKIE